MLCIIFYLNLRLKYVIKYFEILFCKYLRVPVDIKKMFRYLYNGYPHEYGDEFGADIYQASRVPGSYYLYLIRPIDIQLPLVGNHGYTIASETKPLV